MHADGRIIDYANIVKPQEMEESRRFVAGMLDYLNVTIDKGCVPADVTCVSQGWGALQQGCSVNKEPLVLANERFAETGRDDLVVPTVMT